jgi:hypothetical protein
MVAFLLRHVFALSIGLVLGFSAKSTLAQAAVESAPVPDPARDAVRSGRTRVVFGVRGELSPDVRGALQRLLGAELRQAGLTLLELEPNSRLATWARHVERQHSPLISVVLEVEPQGFRVIVIDSQRGRAIARELPGGVEQNAANIEAVVTIVLSASRALMEGLEVASTPVDAMLGDGADAESVKKNEPPSAGAALLAAKEPVDVARTQEDVHPLELHAGVFGTVTTFSEVEALSPGLLLAVALSLPLGAELRVAAARQRTASVATDFGSFALERSWASIAFGPSFRRGSLTFVAEAAFVSEWILRSDTRPAAGSATNASRVLPRFGGMLGARARYTVVTPLSLEIGAGGAYFGRSILFSVDDRAAPELVRVTPLAFSGALGLAVAFE